MTTPEPLPCRPILGLPVVAADAPSALALLTGALAARRKTLVAFVNANLALTCRRRGLGVLLGGRDWLLLNDGIGMDIAARLIHGAAFPANLNGTDFVPRLLADLPAGTRVFLYGAKPASVRVAAERIGAIDGVTVCGWRDGYSGSPDEVVAAINGARADVLLVALGNPRQEEWIGRHGGRVSAPLVLGVGALFDFLGGQVRRAPAWVRRLRLEWVFRLLQEPRRLGRRYTWDLAVFLTLVLRQRLGGHSRAGMAGPTA